MIDLAKDEDDTELDAIEARIHDTLWDIDEAFRTLNSLVHRFQKLGIPATERRDLECEIRKVVADRRDLTLGISQAAYAAGKAAKTAAKSNAA